MQLPFKEAEDLGRLVLTDGTLVELQEWFTLSRSRLATALCTNTTSLKVWLSDPGYVTRIHATTAARVGEFAYQLGMRATDLLEEGVNVRDLYPLSLLAGQLGRSTSSPIFTEMCRTRRITCYDMGLLGTYIPKTEATRLKAKELTW